MRISHLHLKNWRNFAAVDLDLQWRTFLIGPNASGKSNLLASLQFLQDVARVGGGFESAVKDRGGISRIRCLAARKDPTIAVQVDLTDAGVADWRYRLVMGQDNQRRPILKEEVVWHNGKELLRRPQQADLDDPERLRQTHLEQVSANKLFRPVATFFQSIRYFHVVPQLIREAERWDGPADDPYGGDFLERIIKVPLRTRQARLNRIQGALSVAVPQLQELKVERDPSTGVSHVYGRYAHWRPQGAWQNEEDFSDGTLRLLGLLWALLDGSGPLLLEEPELSLHPEVIRYIPQLMARIQSRSPRQLIVSTHSADLLRDRGIRADEIILFSPSSGGTTVRSGASREDVRALLTSGVSLADIVLPITQPKEASQLALFALS